VQFAAVNPPRRMSANTAREGSVSLADHLQH
jgi:hypothetical protein